MHPMFPGHLRTHEPIPIPIPVHPPIIPDGLSPALYLPAHPIQRYLAPKVFWDSREKHVARSVQRIGVAWRSIRVRLELSHRTLICIILRYNSSHFIKHPGPLKNPFLKEFIDSSSEAIYSPPRIKSFLSQPPSPPEPLPLPLKQPNHLTVSLSSLDQSVLK
jgi:hypothetical protein